MQANKVLSVATVPVVKVRAVKIGIHHRLVIVRAIAWEHEQLHHEAHATFSTRHIKRHSHPQYTHANVDNSDLLAIALEHTRHTAHEALEVFATVEHVCKILAFLVVAASILHIDVSENEYMVAGLSIAIGYRLYRAIVWCIVNRSRVASIYREYCARVEHGGMRH